MGLLSISNLSLCFKKVSSKLFSKNSSVILGINYYTFCVILHNSEFKWLRYITHSLFCMSNLWNSTICRYSGTILPPVVTSSTFCDLFYNCHLLFFVSHIVNIRVTCAFDVIVNLPFLFSIIVFLFLPWYPSFEISFWNTEDFNIHNLICKHGVQIVNIIMNYIKIIVLHTYYPVVIPICLLGIPSRYIRCISYYRWLKNVPTHITLKTSLTQMVP